MDIAYLKRNRHSFNSKIKRHIISVLEERTMTRRDLVATVLSRMGLGSTEINDNCVDGACVLLRSYIGTAINEGISFGEIIEQDGALTLELATEYINKADVHSFIKELLKENIALDKSQIFDMCIKHFGADRTFSDKDDGLVRAFAGEFLARCVSSGILTLENGKYYLTPEKEVALNTYESFIDEINQNGGEYFERYGAMLIRKFYEKSGFTVTECAVTGGSDDGGIDIIVRIEDKLGFRDFIAVQAKARRNAHVTVKEVREFIGAMHAIGASKGIYLTTSYFHDDALVLIEEMPSITKIDGKKLFELAKECNLFKV